MADDILQKILEEYDETRTLRDEFRSVSARLLEELARLESLRVHSVRSRIKERAGLAAKVTRLGKQYRKLADVTDVVGVRIITHFEDEVDALGRMIEANFSIDRSKSIDKRKALDPDRFGYLSLHYVCRWSEQRLSLPEYKRFAGLAFEVQVRSILQHAWAEIEHDLGYKAGATIPAPIRRRFSRLAGLLEIADAEFARVRDDLAAYVASVPVAIATTPNQVQLDDVSLQEFLNTDPVARRLSEQMAAFVSATLVPEDDAGSLVAQLRYVGIADIAALRQSLETHAKVVQQQWEERLSGETQSSLSYGISLFHLFQVLLVQSGGASKLEAGFREFGVGYYSIAIDDGESPDENDDDETDAEIAQAILKALGTHGMDPADPAA